MARRFLDEILGVPTSEIETAEDNYQLGDLRTPSGATIEVKHQPIDPARYPKNFVEVFEITTGKNQHHLSGFEKLSELLDLSPAELSQVSIRRGSQRGPLGQPASISVSIQSMAGSAATMYVNPGGRGQAHIYLYRSVELLADVRACVRASGLARGAGRSNDDTCAVFVPLARWRWSARTGAPWQYTGVGEAIEEVPAARQELLPGAPG